MAARAPATTVVTIPALVGVKSTPNVSNKAQATASQVRITSHMMADPISAARAVNDLQTRLAASTVGARTNPRNAGAFYAKGVVFTANTPILIRHNLGREPVGYAVVDTYPPATAAIHLYRTTLPAGLSLAQAINVVPSASGTGTVEVF